MVNAVALANPFPHLLHLLFSPFVLFCSVIFMLLWLHSCLVARSFCNESMPFLSVFLPKKQLLQSLREMVSVCIYSILFPFVFFFSFLFPESRIIERFTAITCTNFLSSTLYLKMQPFFFICMWGTHTCACACVDLPVQLLLKHWNSPDQGLLSESLSTPWTKLVIFTNRPILIKEGLLDIYW